MQRELAVILALMAGAHAGIATGCTDKFGDGGDTLVVACAFPSCTSTCACGSCGSCCVACSSCGSCTSCGSCSSCSGSCSSSCSTVCPAPPVTCTPNTTAKCRVGSSAAVCIPGSRTCLPDGTGFGECVGTSLARPDVCAGGATFTCAGGNDALVCGAAQDAVAFGGSSARGATGVGVDAAGNRYVVGVVGASVLHLGDVTVVGQGASTPFLAKLDATGAALWALPIENATTASITVLSDGSSVIAGTFAGTLKIGTAEAVGSTLPGPYAARIDTTGKPLWARALSSGNHVTITAIASGAGAIEVVGTYSGSSVLIADQALPAVLSDAPFMVRLDEAGAGQRGVTFSATGVVLPISAVTIDDGGNAYAVAPTSADATNCAAFPYLFVDSAHGTGSNVGTATQVPFGIAPKALAVDASGRLLMAGTTTAPIAADGRVLSVTGAVVTYDFIANPPLGTPVALDWVPTGIAADDSTFTVVGNDESGAPGLHAAKFDFDLRALYDHRYGPTGVGADPPVGNFAAIALAMDGTATVVGGLHGSIDLGVDFNSLVMTTETGDALDPIIIRLDR